MIARLLAPIALPLIGALGAALVAALLALWWSVTAHAETRAALRAAKDYIEATDEVRNAQESLPTDDADLPDWLRNFADGG